MIVKNIEGKKLHDGITKILISLISKVITKTLIIGGMSPSFRLVIKYLLRPYKLDSNPCLEML